jgi:hypothetical protein
MAALQQTTPLAEKAESIRADEFEAPSRTEVRERMDEERFDRMRDEGEL